jgi:hypothetical protein
MHAISLRTTIHRLDVRLPLVFGLAISMLILSLTATSHSQSVSGKVFAYSSKNLQGATGQINHANASFTTLKQPFGGFSPWSNVVPGGVDLLFYNSRSGHAAIGQVDGAGNFSTTQSIPDGQIGPGWTHITFHNGYYLFYNTDNGLAAVGNMQGANFRTYNTWNGSFSKGWSQITSTPNGLLFYNTQTGSGEVADWDFVRSGPGFGEISQVNLRHLNSISDFSTGWTHVVNTSNGVLFYCSSNGRSVIVDMVPGGSLSTRPRSETTLPTGYDSILSQNDDILFYDRDTGDIAIGTTVHPVSLKTGVWVRQNYPKYFSPGWTDLVPTMSPSSPH